MKVAILTDTNSGIYTEKAEKMGIFVMPMPVMMQRKSSHFWKRRLFIRAYMYW